MADWRIQLRDLQFGLFEHHDLKACTEHPSYSGQNVEMYEMVLGEAEKLAREVIAPLSAPGDATGCELKDGQVTMPDGFQEAFRLFAEGGWIGTAAPEKFGGMGLPLPLAIAATEMFTGANVAFMMVPGLTAAASRLIYHLSGEPLASRFAPPLLTGQWTGTMCLTEPQAGSAVGDVRTTAVKQDDGTYAIEGSKIFISAGQHDMAENIVHLVLARTPNAPAGTRGLSLFIVPRTWVNEDGSLAGDNDVRCTGIEHKMGLHASPTCSLSFGDEKKCRGHLIGAECEGMRHMFQMMNEARLVVGIQGSSAALAAHEASVAYAQERLQGPSAAGMAKGDKSSKAIIEHANVRTMLAHQRALGEGSRAMMLRAAFLAHDAELAPTAEQKEKSEGLLGLITPICKAYGAELGLEACDIAMQVFGGYGYIREYGVEQMLRDVKIASIYEGTNSIQALDLLARKVPRGGGRDFAAMMQEVSGVVERLERMEGWGVEAGAVAKARDSLIEMTMGFGQRQAEGDVEYAVMHCKGYLRAFGHVIMGWLLLEQGAIATEALEKGQFTAKAGSSEEQEKRFYRNKVETARFFCHHILPEVGGIVAAVASNNTSAMQLDYT